MGSKLKWRDENKFQSTPPVAGRRCGTTRRLKLTATCFNPRLPLPGGDAGDADNATGTVHGFNPRLPLPGGDAWIFRDASRLNQSFNPRLPLPGGDACPTVTSRPTLKFQSTPPVAGRRCNQNITTMTTNSSFNPRLPLPGGDAPEKSEVIFRHRVSIHASRCREAMPSGVIWRKLFIASFNPRLPLPGGDASVSKRVQILYVVSIHASRCREAMPLSTQPPFHQSLVSIHASRCREAMPKHADIYTPVYPFQSTPPVAGRRCWNYATILTKVLSFNPRLPLPGGDALRWR